MIQNLKNYRGSEKNKITKDLFITLTYLSCDLIYD